MSALAPIAGRVADARRDWVRGLRTSFGLGGLVGLVAAADAALLVERKFSYALAFAALPVGLLLVGRSRAVYARLLLPVLAVTLIVGRTFSQIRVGPIYVLDATLVLVLALSLPAVLEAIARHIGVAMALGLFMLITAVQVLEANATRVVLRQSVIGFYSMWAILGIAVARSGLLDRLVPVVYASSIGATLMMLVTGGLHDVAHDLYIAYGVLIVLFLPVQARRRHWLYLVVAGQLAVLAIGLVRSIWVALPLAVLVTVTVTGMAAPFKRHVIRLVAIASLLILVTVAVKPSAVSKLTTQANSIFNYAGSNRSDANARWRLSNWQYGLSTIKRHPGLGIGFGQSEVPPDVCTTGCNASVANDPTVLPGSDLHNSILAIPLRLGVPAFLLFAVFEAIVLFSARRAGRRSSETQWLLACHLLTGFAALTAVVLEGPYMGVFFWFFGGLAIGQADRFESDGHEVGASADVPDGVTVAGRA